MDETQETVETGEDTRPRVMCDGCKVFRTDTTPEYLYGVRMFVNYCPDCK